jgi:hypothetical protein
MASRKKDRNMGYVDIAGHDPRIDLELLPDHTLWDIARNLDAVQRLLAIRILVERGSAYVYRPEIAEDAKDLV